MTNVSNIEILNKGWTAVAPSNIAFVKYWGKRDPASQWPANDSISMTLSQCRTTTTARPTSENFDVFVFGGKVIDSKSNSGHKIFRHLEMLRKDLNRESKLHICSENSFPSDCGIASSASGFAALTLSAAAALTGHGNWQDLSVVGITPERLAHWARRGSGSAGRSMFGGIVRWSAGASASEQTITQITSPSHWELSDVIVVLSDQEKPTSSSEAHLAAWGSPLFSTRIAGIPERIERVTRAILHHDIQMLGDQIECEALEMHAIAMTGQPPVNYLLQETINFTSWVRKERQRGSLPAWFTIDAGANVHMICETRDVDAVQRHIRKAFPTARLIIDQIGQGPKLEPISGGAL